MQAQADLKETYHHGDLRRTLIDATVELVRNHGPEKFSMADACKAAGVSKAAPYRHFKNKEELLKDVMAYGFMNMGSRMKAQSEGHEPGSDDRINALGWTYISFAMDEPELFRLMFGDHIEKDLYGEDAIGRDTFQLLLDEIIIRTQLKTESEIMAVAFPLWTLVHGAATLTINNNYNRIYPDNDTKAMIAEATKQLLANYKF